jgi:glutamate/tyrosine decarboxylase-like PLP-dependent enzyme
MSFAPRSRYSVFPEHGNEGHCREKVAVTFQARLEYNGLLKEDSVEGPRKDVAKGALFEKAKEHALDYMRGAADRRVYPSDEAVGRLSAFDEPLQEDPVDPLEVLDMLHSVGSQATVAQTGGRYFGFVNGGITPAGLAAKWLADAWDQNAALYVISPVASVLEGVCEGWLVDLLGLPVGTAAGFVSGTSIATLCGLAAGRDELLRRAGWDLGARGLFGAPEIRVVLGAQAHSSVYKALSLLGLGRERVETVTVDAQGRLLTKSLPILDGRTLLVLQAGNVSTGAFDPFMEVCAKARSAGSWVHIDGAFGLWAAASRRRRNLTQGIELADSWSADAHKTLNAPYDNGIVFCRDREALAGAMRMSGSYIVFSEKRDGVLYTPDMSRRAHSVELWATLKNLGRNGVAELVDGLCDTAMMFSESLRKEGFTILNEVCFNQVLVSCGSAELTVSTLEGIQKSGECWCGGTQWNGQPAIRISVCSYMTTTEDVARSVRAFVKARETAGN